MPYNTLGQMTRNLNEILVDSLIIGKITGGTLDNPQESLEISSGKIPRGPGLIS